MQMKTAKELHNIVHTYTEVETTFFSILHDVLNATHLGNTRHIHLYYMTSIAE